MPNGGGACDPIVGAGASTTKGRSILVPAEVTRTR
jgi:hypothetical protein